MSARLPPLRQIVRDTEALISRSVAGSQGSSLGGRWHGRASSSHCEHSTWEWPRCPAFLGHVGISDRWRGLLPTEGLVPAVGAHVLDPGVGSSLAAGGI